MFRCSCIIGPGKAMMNRHTVALRALTAFFVMFLFAAFFVPLYTATAASPLIYLEAPAEAIALGSDFPVTILLDSSFPLNAYRVIVRVPAGMFAVRSVDNSSSIIDVWQSQPAPNEAGDIEIVGGSIKPFSGARGELLTLRLEALKEGTAAIVFKEAEAYIADGKGSRSDLQSRNVEISIRKGGAVVPMQETGDAEPPAVEYLSIIDDPYNKDQRLLSFSVRDRESGVKETLARSRSFIAWGPWGRVDNPGVFPASVWAVQFQAIDNRGNVVSKTLYDWPALLRKVSFLAVVLAALGMALVALRRKLTTGNH